MPPQRKAEIPIEFPIQKAKKDLEKTEGLFKKTFNTLRAIEEKTGLFSTFGQVGVAGVAAGAQFLFQSPQIARASAALGATGGGIQALSTLLGAFGGTPGILIGNMIGNFFSQMIDNIGEEIRAVQDRSLNEIQSIAAQFAEVGVSLSNEAIKQLLEERQKINQRVFDAIKQVKEVQDSQTNTLEVIGNAAIRRLREAKSALGF